MCLKFLLQHIKITKNHNCFVFTRIWGQWLTLMPPIFSSFFISNAFFQLSLSVALLFNELSLKCCLSVAYYIEAFTNRDMLYLVYLFLCLCFGLFMFYLYDIFFHFLFFIFITINHLISLTNKKLFFGHVSQKFSVSVLLGLGLMFCQF